MYSKEFIQRWWNWLLAGLEDKEEGRCIPLGNIIRFYHRPWLIIMHLLGDFTMDWRHIYIVATVSI